MKMRPFGRLVPWTTALARLLRATHPIARSESVPVGQAVGRVAAESLRSTVPVPAFDRATWDGYALRSRSTRGASSKSPAKLRLIGEVYAEGGFHATVGIGEAVAIATGGPLPKGADAVIPFEAITLRGSIVIVPQSVPPGDRIARAGEDLRKGALVVREGQRLTPADLGALAITGRDRVRVWARPLVTILPNGTELTRAGRPLARGRIYESNGPALSALVEASGGVPRPLPPVPDDPERIGSAIRRAIATSDLVLVTGGSSVGERDYLPSLFPRFGPLLFHGIAVRPGKPTLAVRADRCVVIGMPGHPASCLSNGFWLLVPVLRRLARLPGPGWIEQETRLTEDVRLPQSDFATVIPLEVREASARPTFHDSSAISSLGGANAFVVWPPGSPAPRRGTRLRARVLLPPLGAFP